MTDQRWQNVQAIWRTNQWLYLLVGFAAGLLAYPALTVLRTVPGDLIQNLIAETLGIGFTVLIIDRIAQRRERYRREYERREHLIHDMDSPDNATAINAVRALRTLGVLQDGTLRGIRMLYSNLQRANLFRADLTDMNLSHAKLDGANMVEATLVNTRLRSASLQGTRLMQANLSGAKLHHAVLADANLKNAVLRNAQLQNVDFGGAVLTGADLTGAKIFGTEFDERTVLPDRTRWHPGVDMKRFIAQNHPDYWHPDNPDIETEDDADDD